MNPPRCTRAQALHRRNTGAVLYPRPRRHRVASPSLRQATARPGAWLQKLFAPRNGTPMPRDATVLNAPTGSLLSHPSRSSRGMLQSSLTAAETPPIGRMRLSCHGDAPEWPALPWSYNPVLGALNRAPLSATSS
jgi:hypothetical protein